MLTQYAQQRIVLYAIKSHLATIEVTGFDSDDTLF